MTRRPDSVLDHGSTHIHEIGANGAATRLRSVTGGSTRRFEVR